MWKIQFGRRSCFLVESDRAFAVPVQYREFDEGESLESDAPGVAAVADFP